MNVLPRLSRGARWLLVSLLIAVVCVLTWVAAARADDGSGGVRVAVTVPTPTGTTTTTGGNGTTGTTGGQGGPTNSAPAPTASASGSPRSTPPPEHPAYQGATRHDHLALTGLDVTLFVTAGVVLVALGMFLTLRGRRGHSHPQPGRDAAL